MSTPFQILISEKKIKARIEELGQEISDTFLKKDLVVVGVLKGSFIFMADLVREISIPLTCEFLRVSSYQNNHSTGTVRIEFDLSQSIEGKHVLLVEDIVDTGKTLRFLLDHLKTKRPASIKVCALLYKEIDLKIRETIDYLGFTIPNDFVVGYGMDDNGLYRSLPDIMIC